MSTGIYLYCLARAGPVGALKEGGLDGQNPVLVRNFREVAAVVSQVPLTEFCGPEAESRLRDLAWVGPRVCRHEAVVEEVMRRSPVLPARFGTMFSSWDRLEQMLEQHYHTLRQCLERLADRQEWAVKGLVDKSRGKKAVEALLLAQEAERLGAVPPGRRYFEEQRLRSRSEPELNRRLRDLCRETRDALREQAQDLCERRTCLQRDQDDGRELLVNWAFLVAPENVPAFKAGIEAANARGAPYGLGFALTGPWPPYSFCPSLTPESDR